MTITLETPHHALLDGYVDALKRGWSSDSARDVSAEQRAAPAGHRTLDP